MKVIHLEADGFEPGCPQGTLDKKKGQVRKRIGVSPGFSRKGVGLQQLKIGHGISVQILAILSKRQWMHESQGKDQLVGCVFHLAGTTSQAGWCSALRDGQF